MRFLLIAALITLGSIWFYYNSRQSLFVPPINFQKPVESRVEKRKENIWLEVESINPQKLLAAEPYYFKIFGEKSSYQTEIFVLKDIRLYKQSGERIIQNRFSLPENMGNIKKITLIKNEKEILSESNLTSNGDFVLKDKTGIDLFVISILKESRL